MLWTKKGKREPGWKHTFLRIYQSHMHNEISYFIFHYFKYQNLAVLNGSSHSHKILSVFIKTAGS